MSLTFGFDATNSSGKQSLVFVKGDVEDIVYPCLFGEYNGEEIQIDFNGLDKQDLMSLIGLFEIQLKRFKEV